MDFNVNNQKGLPRIRTLSMPSLKSIRSEANIPQNIDLKMKEFCKIIHQDMTDILF